MADTHGVPLWFSLDEAERTGCVISLPHYFASAMEAGWDDVKTFGKIREAFADRGQKPEGIELKLISIFMDVAKRLPGKDAMEIGKTMREDLERKGEVEA